MAISRSTLGAICQGKIMSGIVGIIHLNGEPIDPSLLSRMNGYMSWRGPDAQQIWSDGNIGLGHTLLRTTWEAEYEHQPFTLDCATRTPCDRQVWIVADARIDDRENLATKLGIAPLPSPPFTSKSQVITDVELILRAYLHWGDRCVEHLLGDFAVAIWDARQRRLFCARDQLGVKQVYYSQIGNCLLISNTLNCIRQHPQVSSELNEQAIGDFLLFEMNHNLTTTTFADIQRLPAAHTLTWTSAQGLQIAQYWTLPLPELIRFKTSSAYLEHFQALMGAAVGDRLRTDKVASSFSGGLDSTTIAATAVAVAKQRSQPLDLKAFTVVYDALIPDRERYYAGLAANTLGIPIDYQVADDDYPYQDWRSSTFHTPEPLHQVFRTISDESFHRGSLHSRVSLSGNGGDEVFAVTKVVEMLQTMPLQEVMLDVSRSYFEHRVTPHWGSGFLAFLRRGNQSPRGKDEYPEWLNPDFAKRLGLKERWQQIIDAQQVSLHLPRSRAHSKFDPVVLRSFLEGHDPACWRVPIETRFPFFDLRLVNYLLALPPVPWCVDKMLLRTAMKQVLPEEVRLRPKTPLQADPLLAIGVERLDRRSVLQKSPEIAKYIDIDRLLAVQDPLQMCDFWQHLVPITLSFWLHQYLDLPKATPSSFSVDLLDSS